MVLIQVYICPLIVLGSWFWFILNGGKNSKQMCQIVVENEVLSFKLKHEAICISKGSIIIQRQMCFGSESKKTSSFIFALKIGSICLRGDIGFV